MHKGEEFKKLFWNAAYETYEATFKKHINAMKELSVTAYEDFMVQDPRVFCKAFINCRPKCDMMTSNLVETSNILKH